MKTFFEEKMEESEKSADEEEAVDFEEFQEFCRTELIELINLFHGRKIKSLQADFDNVGIKLGGKRKIPQQMKKSDSETDTVEIETKMAYIKSKYLGILHLLNEKGLPFVNVGETVKEGQTLGLVETVNILNEIKSTVNGVLFQVLEEDGNPVEYGQQLFVIEKQ